MIVQIATGLKASTPTWKNNRMDWSEIVKLLTTPRRTTETKAEYARATRMEKGLIKDVGGYVGGYVRGGKRKPENVTRRSLLTLDLDTATADAWDRFTMMLDCEAVMHNTHSSTPEKPKFRLIILLNREVAADEYEPIGRYVAGLIGIEQFDPTGFQAYRLMFWPSCSADAEFICYHQQGPPLDADIILDSYVDWRDSSLWPSTGGQVEDVKRLADKQANPEEKKGIIGAFCRTYNVEDAIEEFLAEEYVQASHGRYTYTKGSTAAGLVVYEDGKFVFSHHGTDPTSGQLCNSFDLVRIHKFGHLDNPGSSKQSTSAMEAYALSLSPVKRTLAREKLEHAKSDFALALEQTAGPVSDMDHPEEDEQVDPLEWAERLEADTKGRYLASAGNIGLILQNDPNLKGAFRLSEFDAKRYVCRSVPWRIITTKEQFGDVDYSGLRAYLEKAYGIASAGKVDDALALEFHGNKFHPVREYLSSLEWDKTPRIANFLTRIFGAEPSKYTATAFAKTLIGAISRIFNPGGKFDLVLVLVGDQGEGKSELIRRLGKGWSSDTFSTVQGKESFEQLRGAWLIEIAELSAFRKAEIEAVKHFLTKSSDSYRPAYGRVVDDFPRQCIFIATTNEVGFLRDPSGNRRFLPIDTDVTRATQSIYKVEESEIDQIWAEAMHRYLGGETAWLTKSEEAAAKAIQAAHMEQDEREGLIMEFLDKPLPVDWETLDLPTRWAYLDGISPAGTKIFMLRDIVCTAEVWVELMRQPIERMDKYRTREINTILKGLEGWELSKKTHKFPLYGRQKYFERKEN